MIPHIPHEELLFLKDPQMDFISQISTSCHHVVLWFDINLRKNLKEEFAFWDKNPNSSTQPDA